MLYFTKYDQDTKDTESTTENQFACIAKYNLHFLFGSNWISLQYQSHLFTDQLSQRRPDATKRQAVHTRTI